MTHQSIQKTRATLIRRCATFAFAIGAALTAQAATINTADQAAVDLFQAGANREGFEGLTGTPIANYNSGQTVLGASEFNTRGGPTAPRFNSGGGSPGDPIGNPGHPIGIVSPPAGDVADGSNVAAPLFNFTNELFNDAFMEVLFPEKVSKVGFWLTHGNVTIFLRDDTGNNLSGVFELAGTEGNFIGIERPAADIAAVAIIPSTSAFTIDDFTYAGLSSTTPPTGVPETGGMLELILAGGCIWLLRHRLNLRRV